MRGAAQIFWLFIAYLSVLLGLAISQSFRWVFFVAFFYWVPMVLADNGGGVAKLLRLPFCNVPISVKSLGQNKTYMAYPTGIALALAGMYLVCRAFHYPFNQLWLNAVVIGFGAVLGDHVKSYFKRQQKIPPGSPWQPYDQIDYVLGGYVMHSILMVYWFGAKQGSTELLVLNTQVLYAITTKPLGNYLFYRIGLRSSPD
jgi:CDP-2,3-bis-(O-geranylgeranyl)-sn-glycerol synthase